MALLVLSLLVAPPDYPKPDRTTADEPVAKTWSPTKAAEYLDGVGVNWTRDRKCVTCHTNLPYLMARPLLTGDGGWAEVRGFFAADVAKWDTKRPADAYVVATAAGLAFADARAGELTEPTRRAFAAMWAAQKPTGAWDWLKCDWPPLEHDDYYGAVLAAVAVGAAPGRYAESEEAKPGLAKLREYLAKTPAPDLHHRAMLLWAATKVPGLMTEAEQTEAVAALKARQRPDGGWVVPALGAYRRRDKAKTPNDPGSPSDGYATGLAVLVLREAGVPATDPVVAAGAGWLRANQRASGRWFTRSLNNDKDHYIANAGTAFAVMALAACGDPTGK